ncbi:MAG: tRNA pseudouridine(55) synthase TruB [Bacilli bacterium]|nr:tRNA pseudouridine(55) synthase TruB [Bacilli bacterium]
MNGVLFINKPERITSRDVVNFAIKKLGIKKIGHTGTLDPLATGVMVLCIGSATKLVDLLTSADKEYIAEVTLGIQTDTLDITGHILEQKNVNITEKELEKVIKSFIGTYNQEVPIYSAIKVNGKKLYEYARNRENVILPKRMVEIKNIELLDYNLEKNKFLFKCLVSKGTYIRSLIRDICKKMNTIGVMSKLERTKQGNFTLKQCMNMEDISLNRISKIEDVLNIPCVNVDEELQKKVLNGQILDNIYGLNLVGFKDTANRIIAIYKIYEKNIQKIKPYIMLLTREDYI